MSPYRATGSQYEVDSEVDLLTVDLEVDSTQCHAHKNDKAET